MGLFITSSVFLDQLFYLYIVTFLVQVCIMFTHLLYIKNMLPSIILYKAYYLSVPYFYLFIPTIPLCILKCGYKLIWQIYGVKMLVRVSSTV